MILFRWLWFLLKVLWWALIKLSALAAMMARAVRTDFRAQGALGTARWASGWELFRAGVFRARWLGGRSGPIVGRGAFGRLMRFNSDGIVQVFAPPGSGKGLGVVIPTLLDYPGSMVVTDVKGENHAITRRYRRKLGKVYVLNPADLARSDRFNPMDTIRKGTDFEQDDAQALADLMVIRDSVEGHWSTKSRSLLAAFILHALHDPHPDAKTLSTVRKLSTGGENVIAERIRDIALHSPSPLAQSIAEGFLGTMGGKDGFSPEFKSIVSDLQKATEPYTEGTPTGRLCARSTFGLEALTGEDVVTLYLCIDEEKLRTYGRWLRLMTGLTVNALTRAKRARRPRHKVVLLLDEARALGRLDVLADAIGYLRAYCTPVLIWQSMPQVRAVYGDGADEFLANASCKVYFGIADNDTAQQVSTACGRTSVRTRSYGVSQSSEAWLRENRSQNESENSNWLIDPSEVQRLPTETAIVKMRHVAFPILTGRADYRKRLRWTFRWDRWDPSATAPAPTADPDPPRGPVDGPPPASSPRPAVSAPTLPPAGTRAPPPSAAAPW